MELPKISFRCPFSSAGYVKMDPRNGVIDEVWQPAPNGGGNQVARPGSGYPALWNWIGLYQSSKSVRVYP